MKLNSLRRVNEHNMLKEKNNRVSIYESFYEYNMEFNMSMKIYYYNLLTSSRIDQRLPNCTHKEVSN